MLRIYLSYHALVPYLYYKSPYANSYCNQETNEQNLCIVNILLSNLAAVFKFVDAHAGTVAAIATIVIAIFTVLLWRSTHKLWEVTKDTAIAAKKSADVLYATEKPHIHTDVNIVSGGLKGDVYTTKIQFRMRNYGKTPAIIRWIKILHNGEPKIPDGPDENVFPWKFGLRMLNKGTPFIETVPIDMERQDWEAIDNDNATKSIFLLIKVEYEDVFGNSDTKDFWWVYKPIDHVWSIYEYPKQK